MVFASRIENKKSGRDPHSSIFLITVDLRGGIDGGPVAGGIGERFDGGDEGGAQADHRAEGVALEDGLALAFGPGGLGVVI